MDNGDVVMVDMTVEKAGVKDKKAFLSLCPRTPEYTSHVIEGFRLRVVQDDGVTIKPDVKFNLTDLSGGIKHFQNRSGKNDSFSITALIHKDDTVRGMKYTSKVDGNYYVDADSDYNNDLSIMDALDYFIRKGEPFYVTTNAVGIDDTGLYIITENGSRKQKYKEGWIFWDLTFTKYIEVKLATYKSANKIVTAAKKAYEKKKANAKKAAKKKAEAKKKTTAKYKLKHKCKYTQLKYSKTKKNVACVKYMQQILYNKKFLKGNKSDVVDGWFGKKTKEAVKAFQKKNKSKYKCATNGKVDKATFKALCS